MARTPGTVMLSGVDVATPDAPRPAASATCGMRAASNAVSARSASTTMSRTFRVSAGACASAGASDFGLRCEKNTVVRTAQIPMVTARNSNASAAAPARLRPALLSPTLRLTSEAHAEAGVGGRSGITGVLDLEAGFRVGDAGQQVLVRCVGAAALASQPAVAARHAVLHAGCGRRERAAADAAALRRVVLACLIALVVLGAAHEQQRTAENEDREHLLTKKLHVALL